MSNLSNLYREIIMDHYKNPRNKGLINDKSYITCHIKNPSCGDEINIESKVENGIITDIRQDGVGCSICCANASILSQVVKGMNVISSLMAFYLFKLLYYLKKFIFWFII